MARTAWLLSIASVAGRDGLHGGSSSSASVAIEAAGLQAVILPCHDCDKWRKMMPATTGTTALSVFVRRLLFPFSVLCYYSASAFWLIYISCLPTRTHPHSCTHSSEAVILRHIKCSLQFATVIVETPSTSQPASPAPTLTFPKMQPKIVRVRCRFFGLFAFTKLNFLLASPPPLTRLSSLHLII